MKLEGKVVWKFGDNVDTDLIIPARFLNVSDKDELARNCFADLKPDIRNTINLGDVIVAGKNFGCGSSREHAPLAIKSAGIAVIIAKSFARIFYRNAFNVGLPVITCPEAAQDIDVGDEVEVNTHTGKIANLTKNKTYQAEPIPPFIHDIIAHGGLMQYVITKKQKKN